MRYPIWWQPYLITRPIARRLITCRYWYSLCENCIHSSDSHTWSCLGADGEIWSIDEETRQPNEYQGTSRSQALDKYKIFENGRISWDVNRILFAMLGSPERLHIEKGLGQCSARKGGPSGVRATGALPWPWLHKSDYLLSSESCVVPRLLGAKSSY